MDPEAVEIIKNKLYFVITDKVPKDIPNAFYFNIDKDLTYENFYEDFGPLDIGKVWKYCKEVSRIVYDEQQKKNIFFHQTGTDFKKHTNAAMLIGAFQVVVLKKTAEKAFQPLQKLKFQPFVHAGRKLSSYQCTILDCLRGIEYAMKLGWFDFQNFDLQAYEHYSEMENGDLNWVIPKKMIALSSPSAKKQFESPFKEATNYIPVFQKLGVTAVVRLNDEHYDSQDFEKEGIKVYDMYFPDGSCPSPNTIQKFLQITEQQKAIAIHCEAGLGRTGTMIGCYAIKHYDFNASDFIAWIRLCRPGSVIGPQQFCLIEMEKELKLRGKDSEIRKEVQEKLGPEYLEKHMKKLVLKEKTMSAEQRKIKKNGEKSQAQCLLKKKKTHK